MSPRESVELRLRAGAVVEPSSLEEDHIIGRMWEDGKLNLVFYQGECVGYRLRSENTPLPHKAPLL